MAEKHLSEDDASRVAAADLAINLADQLINAFQQHSEMSGDGFGDVTEEADSFNDGETDDGNTTEAKDGDGEWQEMAADDDETEEGEDGTKGEGVREESAVSCFSPIDSHGFTQDDGDRNEVTVDGNNVVFTPARVLNFDDSDGDDLSAIDQRYVPRGTFIQSDFMDDRPELHGSEESDMYAASARRNPQMGNDQTQNVRIIEGHDDLDRGAAMSMRLRNNFLQTQMIQLPPLSADDFHNLSANLYDSLEREEHDASLGDDHGEYHYDNMEEDRESTNGEEEVEHARDAFRPQFSDRNLEENLDSFHSGGYVYAGQQYSATRGMLNFDSGEQGDGQAWNSDGLLLPRRSPTRNLHGLSPDEVHVNIDHSLQPAEGDLGNHHSIPAGHSASGGAAASIVVTVPTQTSSNTSLNQISPANIAADARKDTQEVQSVRPKNMQNGQQVRGGPAGKGNISSTAQNSSHDSQQPGPRVSRSDQRMAAAGSQNMGARNRVGVGSSGAGRQAASGAPRPAVQGAAEVTASNGDGDGAVAGDSVTGHSSITVTTAGAQCLTGPPLQSRTSSQGSIHSVASNNSNSRVSGVGKESNTNRNPQRASKMQASKPADQFPAPRGLQPSQSHRQSQQPPALQRTQPPQSQLPTRQGQQPIGKRAAGATARNSDTRASQLQQQRSQLQQEQQMLQQKQRQLQQQQHKLQQLHVGGMDSPDGDNLVHHHPDSVMTQVGQENHRKERDGRGNMSVEVQGMEEVRSRLQGMLRGPRDAATFDSRAFDFADSANDLLMERPPQHFHDGDASSVSGYRGPEEMLEMLDNFPSFSYKMFSDMSSVSVKSDMSTHSENVYLRDCLEKERYRRKHCEQQIQSLNSRLLEVQQQLAVAVSTDKRKDIMIDQLDKQLAKVVEGWKKREADKDEYMRMVMKEKAQIEETLHKQQAMIDSFERDLANTVDELKQERENSAAMVDKMKTELSEAVHDKQHAEDLLQAEKERASLMEHEWEQLKESRDLAEKRAQQAQERLHMEQDSWYTREQELLHKIDQVKDANLKVMQMERVKLEEQTKKAEELEERLHTAETEVRRLEMEVDSAAREKESMRVEMAITEAKFESAQRSLEADLHSQMEREISEQLNEVHEKMRAEQEEQAEKHRRTVSELHQRHQRDMEKQMAALRQETQRKEEDYRQQIADLESRVSEHREENSALKLAKQKLESQRMEVLAKLQFIMQSQWNEAVSLLASTPQRRQNLTSSVASSLGLAMTSGLSAPTQTTSSQSAGPQFNVLSSSTSAADSSRTKTQQDGGRRMPEGSTSRNNLSGSGSPSSQSSQSSHKNIPVHHAASDMTASAPKVSTSNAEPILTLEDISALLSQGRHPPASFSSSLHGVLNSGGLVVQTQATDRLIQQQQQSHQNSHLPGVHLPGVHLPGFQTMTITQTSSGLSSLSGPQAVMIRPPQQSSFLSGARNGTSSSRPQLHEDFSFLSTTDISHDFSHLSRDVNGFHPGGGSDSESVRSMESRGRPQRYQPDRVLELRDLEHGGFPSSWLDQNGSDGRRTGDNDNHLGATYSPSSRNQSMSPPVKQGRDGEQEAEGGILHETDRLNSSYREISRQLEEHQARQRELQHYIRMLLEKPPQVMEGGDRPERDGTLDCESLEISMETVDLDMTDAAQAAQIRTELLRLQQLRDRQHSSDSHQQSVRPKVPPRRSGPTHNSDASGVREQGATSQPTGVLGSEQLAEISRLLSQYGEDAEAGNAVTSLTSDPASVTQLLALLAMLPQQQAHSGTEERRSASTKNSPQGNGSRKARDPHRSKRMADVRHHSAGPDTSLSSVMSDRHDRTMASSTKSTTSRKSDKKSSATASANTSSSSAKQSVRPISKDKQPQAWK